MSEEKRAKRSEGLSPEELEEHTGEALPDREEMSLVDMNVAVPIHTTASDVFSDGSTIEQPDEGADQGEGR